MCGRARLARGARLLGCGWLRIVLRGGSGAPGFRCGRSTAAAEESHSTAHGAADPAEKPRTTPLAGLGRKLGGEGCGCHTAAHYLQNPSHVKQKVSIDVDFFLDRGPPAAPDPAFRPPGTGTDPCPALTGAVGYGVDKRKTPGP